MVKALENLCKAHAEIIGLDMIFPEGDDLVALLIRYLRYALVGLWVAGLAPLVFIKLQLAKPSRKPIQ